MLEKPDSWNKQPAGARDDRLRVPLMELAGLGPDLATLRCQRCSERLGLVAGRDVLHVCARCRRWMEEAAASDAA